MDHGRPGFALLLLPLLAMLSGGWVRAALPDPTRPPPGMGTGQGQGQGQGQGTGMVFGITSAMPAAPLVPPQAATPRVPTAVPRVQALRHHPTDPSPTSPSASALIDGRLFRVGDRLGDATVQEIRPDGVWLRLPRGAAQWLGLYAPESATGVSSVRKEP